MDKTFQENFLKLEGRLNRLRYFKRNLALSVMQFLIGFVGMMFLLGDQETSNTAFDIFNTIEGLIFLYPQYCLNVRRLKDFEGNLSIAIYVAVIGAVFILLSNVSGFVDAMASWKGAIGSLFYVAVTLYLLLKPGTKGSNQYGADPLENN